MKHTLIKTVLVLSILGAFNTTFAGTVSVTQQSHSLEGMLGVTASQTSNNINYVLGAEYVLGDQITFTFTFTAGALIANFPSVINSTNLLLTSNNSDDTSVTYQVTSVTGTTTGEEISFGSIGYDLSLISDSPLIVTVSSINSVGVPIDTAGVRTATIAEAQTQFGTVLVSTPFDNIIENDDADDDNGTSFSGISFDNLSWRVISKPSTTGWLNLATVNDTQMILQGEAGKMTDIESSYFTSSYSSPVFTESEATLSITAFGAMSDDTIFFSPSTAPLYAQEFTLDVTYNYTSAASVNGSAIIASNADAGAWTLAYTPPQLIGSVTFNHNSNTLNGAFCDLDSVLDPGETSVMTVTLTNPDSNLISGVRAQISSDADISFENDGLIEFADMSSAQETTSAALEITLETAGTNEEIDITVTFMSDDSDISLPDPIITTLNVNTDEENSVLVVDSGVCVNRAPLLVQLSGPESVTEKAEIALTVQGLDHDSDDLSYVWTQTAGTVALDVGEMSSSAMLTFDAPEVSEDETYTFSVVAQDNESSSEAQEISVVVTPQGSSGGSMGLFTLLLVPLCFLRRSKR